jgi:hypothetical protein
VNNYSFLSGGLCRESSNPGAMLDSIRCGSTAMKDQVHHSAAAGYKAGADTYVAFVAVKGR